MLVASLFLAFVILFRNRKVYCALVLLFLYHTDYILFLVQSFLHPFLFLQEFK
ncbi:hypothetical protein BMWSH_0038 [Priestia megaterium WSH-002]|uniref:Uncharacterized protein n=1 Tax=Priestia megaterium (strain WSH-002) TaxID=1006007 RepID=A0A8D3WV52_PRIMW|nr:hypothetical protein BMWSH_0038 [Priestia megaterium WSH-002]QLK03812.1 hypothetical protein BMG_0268 [Priestia megaterium]